MAVLVLVFAVIFFVVSVVALPLLSLLPRKPPPGPPKPPPGPPQSKTVWLVFSGLVGFEKLYEADNGHTIEDGL